MKDSVWGEKATAKKNGNEGVVVSGNNLFFYTGVTKPNILQFNKQLLDLDAKHISESTRLGIDPPPIRVRINSGGGSVTAGLAGMDVMKSCQSPIETRVEGFCASAATFISVSGQERLMTESSFILIHQLSSSFWGKYEEFEDEKKNLDLMMDSIRTIYRARTSIPAGELDRLLKRDLLLDSAECLRWGLVDRIVGMSKDARSEDAQSEDARDPESESMQDF